MKEQPPVMSEDETLDAALAGRSLARFGDGELRLALGGSCISQIADEALTAELCAILAEPDGAALACIPNVAAVPSTKAGDWRVYGSPRYTRLYGPGPFGSAFITRPDSAPWIDRPDYWAKVALMWEGRDVVLVIGTDRSLRVEELIGAASVVVVEGPRRDAFAQVDRIEADIVQAVSRSDVTAPIVLMCLGATATVLAARLARKGIHAVDFGHVGMFMRHAGAYRMQNDDLASPAYRAQLQAKHASIRWGKSGDSWAPEVLAWAKELGAETVLDYGCGRGTLKPAIPNLKVNEYDPGIPGKDKLPKPADMVVSTDVLEHIEPDRVDAVLKHQFDLAGRGAFMVISCRLARELLPDGRNAHLTVREPEWWIGQLARVGWKIARSENRKGLCVWLHK